METKKPLFHGCRIPIGRMVPLLLTSVGGRFLLILLLLMTLGIQNARASMDFETWNGAIWQHPTWEKPWAEIPIMFYNSTDSDSFFTHEKGDGVHNGPAVYIDGNYIGSPDEELAWPGSDGYGNESGIQNNQKYNEWWKGTYSKTVNGKTYTFKFWDPRRENNTYSVTMVVYLWNLELDKQHTVTIRGFFKTNGSGTKYVTKTWTLNPIWFPFSNGPEGAKMTDYNHFSINGTLSSSHDPVTVGTTANADGSNYIHVSDLTEKKEYSWNTSSYSNQILSINRNDYYNRMTKQVEYAFKISVADRGDFYLYKWFNVSVPGFVRAKDLQTETDIWNKKITVKWDSDESDGRSKEGAWRIYRRKKGESDWTPLTSSDLAYNQRQYVDADANLEYDQEYDYKIVFIPKNSPNGVEHDELSQTTTSQLARPTSFFSSVSTTNNLEDKITFSWAHPSFENAASHAYTLTVQRSIDGVNWSDEKNISVTSKQTTAGSYEDTKELQAFEVYQYRVKATVFDKDYISDVAKGSLAGMSYVTQLTATRGTYSNMVKLNCSVKQVGNTLTYIDLQRRPLGSVDDDDWITLTTLSGTASSYSYDDVTALPGSYNEYRAMAWITHNDERKETDAKPADGFSVSTGVISGRITYGTGTAVEGVKVTLKQNNADGETVNAMRSLKFSGAKAGVTYNTTNKGVKQLFGKDFSVQLFVSPSLSEMGDDGTTYTLFDVADLFGITMTYDAANKQYLLGAKVGNDVETSTLAIPRGEWRHLTCVHNVAAGTTTIYVAKDGALDQAAVLAGSKLTFTGDDKAAAKVNLAYLDDAEQPTFKGYADEFRVFTKALTEKDILRNYNHPLSGSETGLAIYWPMDEGIDGQTITYDFSKTNNVGNGRHGLTTVPATSDTYVPKEEELSLMGYTNEQGTFEVRGVPFSGEGTSYTIIPTLGIHEFKPAYQSRFVNMSMLNHSGVDFEDVSSFPVKGTIYYAGTDYPVEGVNFYVDGTICSKDGDIIATGADGTYEISVPIGDHVLTVGKNGHVFTENGRYPADPQGAGVKHTFNQKMVNLDFYDETLVNFTGRVVGGDIQGEKPVGFGASVNNIGVTKFELTPLNENPRMNVVKQVTETTYSYKTNTETVDIASATPSINSTAWRGAGADDCKTFFVETDPATGEFSVMVPPLQYKVSTMKLKADGTEVGASSTIDLTQSLLVQKDSIENDEGGYNYYEYNTILKQTYHSTPSFTVTQQGREDGVFGIDSYEIEDAQGKLTIDDICSVDAKGEVTYKYGGAIFKSESNYTFLLKGFEHYKNADTKTEEDVPLAGTVVTINNALSSQQAVYGDENGAGAEPGSVADLQSNEIELDDTGCATYKWKAGLPNITSPFKRTITMDYSINDRPYQWNDGEPLYGIILGSMPTNNNFVTAGPDVLDMVLRDPPGSNSHAEWSKGTVTTESHSDGSIWNSETKILTTSKLGTSQTIGTGFGAFKLDEIENKVDLEVGINIVTEGEDATTWGRTITTSKTISTSSDPAYVGADGDVFIGSSTNLIYGFARNLDFHRNGTTNTASLSVKDALTTGLKFNTEFLYTQKYILNELIPHYEQIRNAKLEQVASVEGFVNNTKAPRYITTLDKNDPKFGSSNHDKKVWGKNATAAPSYEGPSYTMVIPKGSTESFEDSVEWCNNQIRIWQSHLATNERQKVEAYNKRAELDSSGLVKNFSFDAGSSITASKDSVRSDGDTFEYQVSGIAHLGTKFGVAMNKTGVIWDISTDTGGGTHSQEENNKDKIQTFSYMLEESGDDAISVDVYHYLDWGPIFRTRGGQTSAPYEGEVRTNFYEENGEHPVIMESTMQIEVPQIDVENPSVVDVPTGAAANYTLTLGNQSEVGADVAYKLFVLDETNPNGAQLSIDGKVLTEGRLIKVPGNQSLIKTLQLRQTDLSVLDYKNIGVVFASESQPEDIADTIYISAQFVPSSSDVMLAISQSTMNTRTGSDLVLTFSNFDRNYKNLKAFRLQYKKQGSTDWTQLKEYVLNSKDKTASNDYLPSTGANISYTLPMANYTDGDYTFRVVSVATYGTDEVYKYSDELTLVKDMVRPRPIGQPEPTDGIFDIGDDLSVTFNEPILGGELTKAANFMVTGVLNGAEIDHETALSMQATEMAATTEASINLDRKDFSIDAWVNVNGAGTLLSHGQGEQKLTVGTNADGQLVVTIAGTAYTSANAVPKDKWSFLSLSVGKSSDASIVLNATVADDANETMLFQNQTVKAYEGNGPLSVGCGAAAAMHELLLWDEAHDMATALLNRSRSKAPSTRHLIGYWKMNEGEGTEIRDYARNRHMTMTDETWYMNNVNKAVNLDGQHYVSINTAELNTFASDDSAIEFWVRGAQQTAEAQLLQMGDVALWTNAEGELQLTGKGAFKPAEQMETYATKSGNILDNAWHHIALNILRQGAAAVYVDGKRCLTVNGANVGTIATDKLIVGAKRTTFSGEAGEYTYERAFKGQVDEIRVWNATLNADLLVKNRKVRLTGGEAGLVAYYPFERKQLDSGNQVQTVGDDADLTGSTHRAELLTLNAQQVTLNYTDEAPALRTKPSETNVSFTFVASDNQVFIEIDEDPAIIENCTLNFTVCDLRDENGNFSEPAVWSAFVNRKQLEWGEDVLAVTQEVKEETQMHATVVNKGGQQQMWTLSDMPSWLNADIVNGTTNPLEETDVTFTVSSATPIGKYEETVYLTGNDGIEVPLVLNVTVMGQVPDWSVNPRDFESSMNVIGRVELEGVPMNDQDDILAAFIGEECRGVAHLEYKQRYDGYFVTMDIYGNKESANKPVTFRAYDASTGTVYPVVEPDKAIKYESLALIGKYSEPVVFTVQDLIEQSIPLKEGWNWLSIGVKADDMTVPAVFEAIADDVIAVKGQADEWLMNEAGQWKGSMKSAMMNERMYAVQMSADRTLRVVGQRIKPTDCQVTAEQGWNWIGYYGRKIASVKDALAGLEPEDGDILKGQSGVTYFDTYEWSGSLRSLEPGKGYMLKSTTEDVRTFGYPTVTVAGAPRRHSLAAASPSSVFTPVNFRKYSGNAMMTLRLTDGGKPVANAELGIFVDDECRTAAVTDQNGVAYLTIPGDDAATLTFKVSDGNEVAPLNASLRYETDAIYGTPAHPFGIDLDGTTGLDDAILENGAGADQPSVFDLQGRKLNPQTLRLNKGVYIINGTKQSVQ